MKDGKDENPASCHPFYKVNIHEARAAAFVARSVPFLLFVTTVCLLVFGVLWNPVLLLTITAVLNVAMWLWIVSTALFCILGVRSAQDELQKFEASVGKDKVNSPDVENQAGQEGKDGEVLAKADTSGPSDASAGKRKLEATVRHTIVLPNYKEDMDILKTTLQSLSEARGSSGFIVVLAMEAREAEAEAKAKKLEEEYGKKFFKMFATHHPTNLVETHLDGTKDQELKGKAPNVKHAVQQVCIKIAKIDELWKESDRDVLTVCDADVIMHPYYFEHISCEFAKRKEDNEHQYTMWQAPQLPWRNFHESPVVSRVWGYISSLWEFGGVSSVLCGWHHMVFSAYSLSLKLASDVSCWEGDVIAEDHHAFLKAWFYSAYVSHKTQGDVSHKLVRVKPVMLPSKSTSVNSSESYWASWSERWDQAKRHAQGVAEVSYAVLAAWDMLGSVPVTSLGPRFLWMLIKIVFKPIMMHIVATTQAIALAVLTVYWVAKGEEVPWCPNKLILTQMLTSGDTLLCGLAGAWVLTWPVVVPFGLLMVANYLMLRTCFIQPGHQEKEKQLTWHKEDGCVKPWESWWLGPAAGSKLFATATLLIFDCVVCLGPIMAIYGVLVEILAYWNVFVRGNRFEYVTASKAMSKGTDYGAVETAKAPPARGEECPSAEDPPKTDVEQGGQLEEKEQAEAAPGEKVKEAALNPEEEEEASGAANQKDPCPWYPVVASVEPLCPPA